LSIPKIRILVDSQSTIDVFSNARLSTKIRETKCTLTLHCNSGEALVTQETWKDIEQYGTTQVAMRTFCHSMSTEEAQGNI